MTIGHTGRRNCQEELLQVAGDYQIEAIGNGGETIHSSRFCRPVARNCSQIRANTFGRFHLRRGCVSNWFGAWRL